ncbi:30313_t:CDS:1, partial [Gigaspora margarita]
GFISKQNNNTGVTPSVRNTDDTENPELHIIGTIDLDEDTIGRIVCISGYFTHVDCGRVLSVDDVIISASDIEYSGVVKIDHLGCEGDSGAPVFIGDQGTLPDIFIVGMLTGGIKAEGFCVVVPIKMLITDDIELLTINNI